MSVHARVRLMLYEYVRNELTDEESSFVTAHLATCKSCQSELQHMDDALQLVTMSPAQPSDDRTNQYWETLASSIVETAAGKNRKAPGFAMELFEWIEHVRLVRAKHVYAVGGAVTLCLVVLTFLTLYSPTQPDLSSLFQGDSKPLKHATRDVAPDTGDEHSAAGVPVQRMSQYFRRSKTLLVGIANLKAEPGNQLDFSSERRVSRDLLREARYLRQQPIDPRSRHLMNELERILIELENIKQHNDLPNVEIIRGGIHHENLLFKIRMAEAMYDSANIMYANEQREQ